MINEQVFINAPLNFEKGVKIYPPTVKEVITQSYFPIFRKLLMSSQEDIEDDIEEKKKKNKELKIYKIPTPFEFLFNSNSFIDLPVNICPGALLFLSAFISFTF